MKKMLLILPLVICTGCLNTSNELDTPIIIESPTIIETQKPIESITSEPIIDLNEPTQENIIETIKTPEPEIQLTTTTSPTSNLTEKTQSPTPEITPKKQYEEGIEIGNRAIDFSSKNLSNSEIKLSDYKGKTILLNFWATWCGPCVRELPSIQKIHENYSDVVVITVNCGENPEDIKNFMDKNNYTFNVLADENGIISHLYFADYIPLSLVINPDGIITKRHIGSLTEDEMLKLIGKGEE